MPFFTVRTLSPVRQAVNRRVSVKILLWQWPFEPFIGPSP